MAKLIARKYAKALFEIASDEKNHDAVGQELLFVLKCLEEEPVLYQILENPLVATNDKKKYLVPLLKGI